MLDPPSDASEGCRLAGRACAFGHACGLSVAVPVVVPGLVLSSGLLVVGALELCPPPCKTPSDWALCASLWLAIVGTSEQLAPPRRERWC